MRTVLLVTDLEGVAGVDSADALFACSPDYSRACALLTGEVRAVIEGLRAGGFDRVRITDSHHTERREPNLRAADLPAGVELAHRDEDAYAEDLLAGVDAVACLGMHAAANRPGFAPHTVGVHCAWEAGGRSLSETDLVLGLAAELGIPTVFVSGDDALGATLGVPCVVTKTALSATQARSRPVDEVHAALRAAAAAAPVPSPALPPGPWQLRFKSRWQAGNRGVVVALDGETARERYRRGLALIAETEPPLGRAVRGFAPSSLREDALASLTRGFERAPPPPIGDAARRALAAFLRITDGDDEWRVADRAMILHLLAGHAPGFCAAEELGPIIDAAVARLAGLPQALPIGLDSYQAMRRVDAVYVRASRGLAHGTLPDLQPYVKSIIGTRTLHAWLMWEMARQVGLAHPVPFPSRPLRQHSRLHDLYWLTHEFVLATHFLHRPFDAAGWGTAIEELFLAVPYALADRRVDLAAEIAFCLQLAGEEDSREHRDLVALILGHQREDGLVPDPSLPESTPEGDAHSTGTSLIALARLTARR